MRLRQIVELTGAHTQSGSANSARTDCQQRLQRLVTAGLRITFRIDPGQNPFETVCRAVNQIYGRHTANHKEGNLFAPGNPRNHIRKQTHAHDKHRSPHVRLDHDQSCQRYSNHQWDGK